MESQVLRGYCLDVLPTLPQAQFQTVFLDPPYNIGVDYGNGSQRTGFRPTNMPLCRCDSNSDCELGLGRIVLSGRNPGRPCQAPREAKRGRKTNTGLP